MVAVGVLVKLPQPYLPALPALKIGKIIGEGTLFLKYGLFPLAEEGNVVLPLNHVVGPTAVL